MKIAMIGHKRIPSREGGVEIVVEELATRMVEKGHSVTVYNRKGKHVSGGKTVNLKDYKGVKIKSVPTFENGKLNAMVHSVIATFLALFSRYDVIHFSRRRSLFDDMAAAFIRNTYRCDNTRT